MIQIKIFTKNLLVGSMLSVALLGMIPHAWAQYTKYQTLKAHTNDVKSVEFSPDGTMLASASYDKIIKIWSLQNNQWVNIQTLKGHKSYVNSVALSPDGTMLASGSSGKTIKIWLNYQPVTKVKCAFSTIKPVMNNDMNPQKQRPEDPVEL